MQLTDSTPYIVLALLLVAWCTLHSTMISISVTSFLQKQLGTKYRFYRLFFNLTAIATLIPVFLYARTLNGDILFSWTNYLRIIQALLIGSGLLLFYLGARHYDARQLLGLAQIKAGTSKTAIGESGKLETSGVLSVVRHPWYLGLLLLIWARQLDLATLIINLILSIYLVVGSMLEEKKLLREFGAQYRRYQETVSMLFPIKWLMTMMRRP